MALINIANPKGGRPLGSFDTICIDRRTGMSGYKIGYLDSDYQRGEPVVIPLREYNRFTEELNWKTKPKTGLIGGLGQKMIDYTTHTSKARQKSFLRHSGDSIEWM